METVIVHFAVFFTFYILGAYATTDILRLLRGATTAVNHPDCYCPICHKRISLKDQIPLFAYLKNHGACRNCGSRIPLSDFFLELFLFLLLSIIAILSHFSWTGFGLCVAAYEGTKLLFLLRFGRRENAFWKNLAISLSNNLFLFCCLAFFFALEHMV